MSIIEQIESPTDLKKLPRQQLPELARELRSLIVNVVAKNGGHLASSLGAVELAIALHYVFDTPKDKIVWDVGHQAYAHKLLTGRRDQFHTLRKFEGVCGFTRMSESCFDAFTTGHSSTSISAGLGIARGRYLKKDPARTIAVIGDGSMTAGQAFEGLNQVAENHEENGLIVILNDNDMSISRNVGALSSFLSRTLSAKSLQNLRKELGDFLKWLPGIGDDMYQLAKRSEESFKAFVTPGMLFEAFNLDYFGPINGHRLDQLIDILKNIKDLQSPVLLHVTTRKGKGYGPAEQNPVYFHGVGSFEKKTGNSIAKAASAPNYTQVFGQTMVELAHADKQVVAVTAAMPEGTGLTEFAEQFPERFFDVGIAEQHGVTFAAGLATEGFKPVVAIYSTFLQRAYDQILHDVCIEALPVTFAIDRAGIVGEDGATHHGLFDLCYLRSLPNMVLMAPADENELRRMLKLAIDLPGPAALRYPRGMGQGVAIDPSAKAMPLGKVKVVARGDDVLILALGPMVAQALIASKQLAKDDIHATVVNCRFVKPFDIAQVAELAHRIPRIVTVEENVRQGGFGSMVLESLFDAGCRDFDLQRLGVDDCFVEHGPQSMLRARHGLDSHAIEATARSLIDR